MPYFYGWGLRLTNTVKVIWRISSFTGRGRQTSVLLHTLLQARVGT